MNIYLIGVIISIVIYMLVGNFAGKKVKDVNDYYVSGRNAGTLLIAGTLFASMVSTNSFLGDTAWIYDGNFGIAILLNGINVAGYVIGPLIFGRYLRRAETLTMPEYFGRRFASRRIQRFAGFSTAFALTIYLIAVTKASGMIISKLTNFSYPVCLLIAFIAFTSFTFFSGSKGVILTDTMMFMLFIGATVIAAPFIFEQAGGLSNLFVNIANNPQAAPDAVRYFSTGADKVGNIWYAIALGSVWLIAFCVSPWQAGRGMMAKNEHVVIRAGATAAVFCAAFLPLTYFFGLSMIQIKPGVSPSEYIMINACMEVMPKLIGVLVLTGIVAAGLSSASTFLSVASFSVTNDLFSMKFRDDKHQLRMSRLSMAVVAVIALFFAYMDLEAIRVISWFSSTVIAASWGVVAVASIFSKKISEKGAFWGMITGFVTLVGLTLFSNMVHPIPNYFHPFFLALLASLAVTLILSKLYPPREVELEYQKDLLVVPKKERKLADYKRDIFYGYGLIVAGVAITTFLIVVWVRPVAGLIGG